MLAVRLWSKVWLAAAWVAGLLGVAFVRWLLDSGTYVAVVEGRDVTRLAGYWSPAFASFASALAALGVITTLVALTVVWATGKRDRAAYRAASGVRHQRRVLM